MKEKPKIGFISLGCPKNQVDTEVMLHELAEAGYELVGEDTEADVIIVNTCAFIDDAKKESIDNILDAAWLKEHGKLRGIIVCGCLSERYREQVFTELPEVDAILGVGSIHDIVEAVESVWRDGRGYSSFRDVAELELGGDRVVTTPQYTAYLKIAEGCDNRCTYCAIPMIRGRYRSRPMEEILAEAKDLCRLGAKELVIVAQDTSRYGDDLYGGYRLAELLRRLSEETDARWLRVLYCYPDKITDELIDEIARNNRIVKYIDLPIQHISDGILRRMNRRGDGALIRRVISELRRRVPGIAIRSTAIVGFPGETEEEFEELCSFIKEAKFEHFGAFAYSREEGTPAYDMPDQIDEQVKQDRLDRLMAIQYDNVEARLEALCGSTVTVLCEGFDTVSGHYYGRCATDAPEIDGRVFFTSKAKLIEGEFIPVRVTGSVDYDPVGEAVPDKNR